MTTRRHFGWVDRPEAAARAWSQVQLPDWSVDGSGEGATVLLHRIWTEAVGRPFPVWSQGIGDCVSQGWALALTVLQGVQIARGTSGPYLGDVATEPIYGGSRVEVGQRQVGRGDGSIGAWAARWATEWGVLFRRKYDQVDLTTYDPRRARSWGWDGVPDVLEPIARKHPIGTARRITSYEQARDWMASVQGPVVVCSDVGFDGQQSRDRDGFLKPRGSWPHCMCFVAVDDTAARPGLLCCNSWGPSWLDGPTRHDQPPGSFWVDARTADRMLAQGDSHGVSDFRGSDPTPANWVMY